MPAGANGEWTAEYIAYRAGRRPDLAREDFLRDQNGKPLGGPTLQTRLDWLARLDAVWDAIESVAAENNRAVASMVCQMAAEIRGMPAPDALAAIGLRGGQDGRQAALLVLRAAGIDPEPQRYRWAEERALQRQHSSRPGNLWNGPEYDPRVIEAIRTGSMFDVADATAQVDAERRREAEEAIAASPRPPGGLYETRTGWLRETPTDRPLFAAQRSIVRREVPELGSEPVEPVPPGAA